MCIRDRPKVNIQQQDRIAGAEVLARWQTDQELISPGVFIPVFEKNGFIVSLDRYMFENACIWLADHLKNGGQELNIAVNVSRLGLLQPDFVDYYVSVKNRYGIPDGLLELEFTESIILEDIDIFCSAVLELKKPVSYTHLDVYKRQSHQREQGKIRRGISVHGGSACVHEGGRRKRKL